MCNHRKDAYYSILEVHNDPSMALCDGSCMLRLDGVEALLDQIMRIHEIVSE